MNAFGSAPAAPPKLAIGAESAATRLVEGLHDGGVSAAFGLDDPRGFFAALRKSEVEANIVHDERAGGFMADGCSRASGRPVACSGISGPGAINLAPPLLEAYMSNIPLVAVVGEFLPAERGRRCFQEAAHASFLGAGLTKEVVEVRHGSEAYAGARHAAETAASGRPRPVLLLVSDGLLWQDVVDPPERSVATLGALPYSASPAAVREACETLTAAERPVILAGAGVHASGAYSELLQVARRFGAPVATSMSGKGAIAEDDPAALGVVGSYTSGHEGRGAYALDALREASHVLVVGSDLDALTVADGAWPRPETEIIRIDIDAEEIRSFPGRRLHGDARAVLAQMLAEAPDEAEPDRAGWPAEKTSELAELDAEIAAADRSREGEGDVWPGLIMQEINARMGLRDWVVSDASYSSSWVLDRLVQRRSGRQVLAPRGVGTLGWGLAAGMGVRRAAPDGDVTVVSGDGALFFGLPELETAVRWGLDLNLIVLRNGVYGSQRQSNMWAQQQDYEDLAFGQGGLDHCALAVAAGWSALRVGDGTDFAEAYDEARHTAGPTLMEVAVDADARPPLLKFDPVP
ncbi:MAG: thiamine pyrophosphate-binding protein [Actinobacteria bacterium]|nr:thiamine pyrophosphate-binding protein [Actinomycetota bacterium]